MRGLTDTKFLSCLNLGIPFPRTHTYTLLSFCLSMCVYSLFSQLCLLLSVPFSTPSSHLSVSSLSFSLLFYERYKYRAGNKQTSKKYISTGMMIKHLLIGWLFIFVYQAVLLSFFQFFPFPMLVFFLTILNIPSCRLWPPFVDLGTSDSCLSQTKSGNERRE